MTSTSADAAARSRGTGQPLAVDLAGVQKNFGSVHAVQGVDLSVSSGEIVALLGPNGAGKTTSIDMILGLSQPSSGTVSVFHVDSSRGVLAAALGSPFAVAAGTPFSGISLAASSDGRFLYASSSELVSFFVYSRDDLITCKCLLVDTSSSTKCLE